MPFLRFSFLLIASLFAVMLFGEVPSASAADSFVSQWKTYNAGTSTNKQISLPLSSTGTYNFTVDWGDSSQSTITAYNQADVTHTYTLTGTYLVTITGTIEGWRFNNGGDKLKILDIRSWGPLKLGNSNGYFYGCSNLIVTATDAPDLTGTTTMESAFQSTNLSTANGFEIWDVSGVTNMRRMFYGATNFNQDIDNWDVSHVTDMYAVFYGNTLFNQDIDNWDVGHATILNAMFMNCLAFNQDISGWDISSATNIGSMFRGATAFNQDIGDWDTSKVVSMSQMFNGARIFNQDIGDWNTGNVITMTYMFLGALAFNQDIGGWNVGSATDMTAMFYNADAFNQDISGWDVSHVTNMTQLFYHADAFNQDISDWNVSSVANMSLMFTGVTLSPIYYSNMLVAWSKQNLQSGVTLTGGSSKYYLGVPAAARASMIADHGWAITDGGTQAQATFNDAASNLWGSGATWGNAGMVEGTDYPCAYDLVTVDSHTVTLGAAGAATDVRVEGSGALDLASQTLTVLRDLAIAGGTFTASNGTLALAGFDQTLSGASITFRNLTIDSSSGGTIITANQTVTNALTVTAGSTLNLNSYNLTATNASITNLGTITESTGKILHPAILSTPSSFTAGETVTFTVTDSDENIDGSTPDTITLTIDREIITLTETGNATGIFTGSIPSLTHTADTVGDGYISRNDVCAYTVIATYTDAQDASDASTAWISVTDPVTPCPPPAGGGRGSRSPGRGGIAPVIDAATKTVLPTQPITVSPLYGPANNVPPAPAGIVSPLRDRLAARIEKRITQYPRLRTTLLRMLQRLDQRLSSRQR